MRSDFYAEYYELEDSHWWFLGRRAVFLRLLDRFVGDGAGATERRVLDVGCGTGAMLPHLARYGRVEGVDTDAEAVRFCRERGIKAVRQVGGGALPYDDASFDLVTVLDVIEHVDDDAGMVCELRRVLRPGGTLLVSVPAYRFLWGPQDEIAHHKRRYRAPELRALLGRGGLTVRRVSYFNTILFPPIAAIRVLRLNRAGSGEARSDFGIAHGRRTNRLLARAFAAEAPIVERVDLPFGVSIVAVATG